MLMRKDIIGIGILVSLSSFFVAITSFARDTKHREKCLRLAKENQREALLESYCEAIPKKLHIWFKDVDGKTEYLPTLASIMDDGDVLRELIKLGFDLRCTCVAGLSPLAWAIQRKSGNACKVLLEHIWHVEKPDPMRYVQPALDFSIQCENGQATYSILEFCMPEGWTPVTWAVSQRMQEALCVMLTDTAIKQGNWGKSPDGKSPLTLCVEEDMLAIAEILLSAGADPLSADAPEALSPLENAAMRGNEPLVLVCATAAAERATSNRKYVTALHWAVANSQPEIVTILLKQGVDVTLCDDSDNTALHFACEQQNAGIIALLVEAGAPVDVMNKKGLTPLDICARNTDRSCLVALIAHQSSMESTHPFGWNPLIMASRRGNVEAVSALLQAGALIDDIDKEGNTALYWAARYGHLAVVQQLVAAGASVNHCNMYGWNPLFWACKNHHAPVVRFLLDHGADAKNLEKHVWFLRYVQMTCALKHAISAFRPEGNAYVS